MFRYFPRPALLAMMALPFVAGCAPPVHQADTSQPATSTVCDADCVGAYSQYPALNAAPSLAPDGPAGNALQAELFVHRAQRVSTITVELYDATGRTGGSGTLTYDGGDRWSGTIQLTSQAPAGIYTPEVILTIGRYDEDPEVIQSIYLYDPWSSKEFYLVANNRIVYEPGRVTMYLARSTVSSIPLNTVTLGSD